MLNFIKEKLFNGAGERLKNVIAIIFVIEVIASASGMISLIKLAIEQEEPSFIFLALFEPVIALAVFWFINLLLYAFAELSSNSQKQESCNNEQNNEIQKTDADIQTTVSKRITCSSCGTENDVNVYHCANCGVTLKRAATKKTNYKACPICGTENNINNYHCDKCGTKLK